MCGIAGIIYRGDEGRREVGRDMTRMLQAMKHRGPDSTGYALYRPTSDGYVMHVKLAEGNGHRDFEFEQRLQRQRRDVEARLRSLGARIHSIDSSAEHALTLTFDHDGDLKQLADYVEDVRGVEVLSLGRSLEIVKDLGDAETVAAEYALDRFVGTHAIGHARMATESDVDIANAHPYWAYPFPDVAVVHNGQLTNYHQWRRRLERAGHRFQSMCDSEIIAVYWPSAWRRATRSRRPCAGAWTISTASSPTSASPRTPSGWRRTSSARSRSSCTSPTTSSPWHLKRSRSARS